MAFALDLSAFAKKTDAKAEAVVKRIVLDVGKSVIEMSPVGDASYWKNPPPAGYVGGRFKGNWQYGLNATPDGETGELDTSPLGTVGDVSSGAIEAAISDVKVAGNVHYILNNVPYATRLEEGWSRRQAPQGMVMITVIKFQGIVSAAAQEMK